VKVFIDSRKMTPDFWLLVFVLICLTAFMVFFIQLALSEMKSSEPRRADSLNEREMQSIQVNDISVESVTLTLDVKFTRDRCKLSVHEDVFLECTSEKPNLFLGVTGAGKSTLFNLICGKVNDLQDTDKANLTFRGREYSAKEQSKRDFIEYFPQHDDFYRYFQWWRVEHILLQSLHILHGKRSHDRHDLIALLNKVGLQENTLNAYYKELSGGERLRVRVASMITSRKEVLIFDEPTSGIDPITAETMIDFLATIAESQNKIILFLPLDFEKYLRKMQRSGFYLEQNCRLNADYVFDPKSV